MPAGPGPAPWRAVPIPIPAGARIGDKGTGIAYVPRNHGFAAPSRSVASGRSPARATRAWPVRTRSPEVGSRTRALAPGSSSPSVGSLGLECSMTAPTVQPDKGTQNGILSFSLSSPSERIRSVEMRLAGIEVSLRSRRRGVASRGRRGFELPSALPGRPIRDGVGGHGRRARWRYALARSALTRNWPRGIDPAASAEEGIDDDESEPGCPSMATPPLADRAGDAHCHPGRLRVGGEGFERPGARAAPDRDRRQGAWEEASRHNITS
jgi:hypothetical protein